MNKLFIATLLFAAPYAFAEASGALSIAPAVVMLKGHAGESTTQMLTLTNQSDTPFAFEMVAEDVVVRGGRRVFSDAGAIAGSIAATAVFSQKEVTVAPGQSAHVAVTVTIPPMPSVRAIVALFRGKTKIDRAGMKMTASVGTLLTFTMSDGVQLDAAPPSITPPSAAANLAVAQHCSNRGSEPLVARGVLAIVDAGGRLVGKTAVAPHRLLPAETWDMKTEYAGELAPGRYRALLTYDVDTAQPVTTSAEFEVR
jgi:hypothetical protein